MKPLMPRLHLLQDGLAMFLGGELQVAVYTDMLDHPGTTIRQTYDRMRQTYRDQLAYTTVSTVANKLCDKGVLHRKKHATKADYLYTASVEENELIARCVQLVVDKLREEYPDELAFAIVADRGEL